MKSLLFAATMLVAAAPAMATDVGVSISVGEPGFYGQIDIGNVPRPVVINPQPVIIQPAPRYVEQPLYLRVPPGHIKKWSKHCAAYNACGRQVYFVKEDWYNNVYVPSYRAKHEGHGNEEHGK